MQQDNYQNYQQKNYQNTGNTTNDFIREKKCKALDWPSQSPELIPIEHAFHLLKGILNKNKKPQNNQ